MQTRFPPVLLAGALALASAGCIGGWTQESSPSSENLHAVWAAEDGTAFAVGDKGTVLRRSGGGWRALDSGIETDLYGVWGVGPEQVVVVGADGVALQFDGLPEDPPDGGEPPPDLRALDTDTGALMRAIGGVPGANSALAVGDGRIQHYDGSRLANFAACGDRLLGVSVPVEGNALAVGEGGTLCLYRDGGWQRSQVTLCPVPPVDGACPMEEMLPILWGAWLDESGQGAVAGSFGGLWVYPPPAEGPWLPVDTGLGGDLRAVTGRVLSGEAGGTEILAAGHYGAVVRLRGDKLTRDALGTNEHINGVWLKPDGSEAYAVGENGTISHLLR